MNDIKWRTDIPDPTMLKDGEVICVKYLEITTCNHEDKPSIHASTVERTTVGRIEFDGNDRYHICLPLEDLDTSWISFYGDMFELPNVPSQKNAIGSVSMRRDKNGVKNLLCLTLIITAWAPCPKDIDRYDESKRYKLSAYDKDNDEYNAIMYSDSYDELKAVIRALWDQELPVVNPDGTEPDWYSIIDTYSGNVVKSFGMHK